MGNLVQRQYVIQVGLSIFKKEECNVANKSALGITQPLTHSRKVSHGANMDIKKRRPTIYIIRYISPFNIQSGLEF